MEAVKVTDSVPAPITTVLFILASNSPVILVTYSPRSHAGESKVPFMLTIFVYSLIQLIVYYHVGAVVYCVAPDWDFAYHPGQGVVSVKLCSWK